jgi:catechol 2,3-dioxygenase-like lactoylglutathione lyase family enzyme
MASDARVFGAIHHTVLVVRNMESSLRFYHDGLGLDILRDIQVYGDWPALFGAPSHILRAVFLGDAQVKDLSAGVLELNAFDGPEPADAPQGGSLSGAPGAVMMSAPGAVMMSFFSDVEKTLGRLSQFGLGGHPRRVVQPTASGEPVNIAAVLDPDGVIVLLISGSITQGALRPHPPTPLQRR